MSRSKTIKPRKIQPDAKYGSVLVSKIINRAMYSGKKTAAQKQVYTALDLIKAQTKQDPLEALELEEALLYLFAGC